MRTRIPGLLFEAVAEAPAGGGETGGEPVESPVEAPGGEPVEAPDAGGGETEAPDFEALLSSPEGQQALQRALYEQGLVAPPGYEDPYAQYGPVEEEADPLANFDFLDENAPQQLAAILAERDQRLLEAINGSPALAHAQEQHHQQWATDQFGQIEQSLGGELPSNIREMAIAMAAGSRPPDGPGLGHFDPGRALHDSAKQLHTLIQSERAAAVKAYQEGVTGGTAGGVSSEPPAGGVGAVHSEPQPSNMREAREAWERRNGLRD